MSKHNDDIFFDDCPICRAQKKALEEGRQIGEEELREAFRKAKEEGHPTGGKWFEEN